MGPRLDDDQAAQKHLKVYVGGLPDGVTEQQVGDHFSRYGHVSSVSVLEGDGNKAPYAFVTYKFAADADCSVVDPQPFPGSARALGMGFATPRRKDQQDSKTAQVSDVDPCKVFVGGICDRDPEDQVGDFFSQWGLIALVYRDKGSWGFVRFATKEGALRLLQENKVVFRRRRLDIKASDSKRVMDEGERQELVKRAIARHFHKKSTMAPPALPPHGACPPPMGYPPAPGYYNAPPPGPAYYPPPNYYGAPPQGAPPPGSYPPQGYQPPGYPPASGGYYGGAPPPAYYGAPPPGGGAPPTSVPPAPTVPGSEPMRALPAPSDYYRPPASNGVAPGADPYAGGAYPPRPSGDPYGAPPPPGGPESDPTRASVPPGYSGYYRDARDDGKRHDGDVDRQRGAPDDRRVEAYPGHPPSYPPSGDPYYRAAPPGDAGADRQRTAPDDRRPDAYPALPPSYPPSSDPRYGAPPPGSAGYYPTVGGQPSSAPSAYGAAPPPSSDPYGRPPPTDPRYAHGSRYQPY